MNVHSRQLLCGRRRPGTGRRQGGIILITALIAVMLTSLTLLLVRQAESEFTRRHREAELMFVGKQFQRAITSYYNLTPAGRSRELPLTLEDLLLDRRFATPVRHLRQLYPDPITGRQDWHLVMRGGRIQGVQSKSTQLSFRVLNPAMPGSTPAPYSSFFFGIADTLL